MASHVKPDIILYDLACTKSVSFSPVVWRIRLMLNYKNIPYKTIFLEFPDIEPTLKELWVTFTSFWVSFYSQSHSFAPLHFHVSIQSPTLHHT